MRAVLIINPVSGDDVPNAEKVPELEAWLSSGDFTAEVIYTTPEKSAGEIAREAVERGIEIVMVGGGDGTVSQVARALVKSSSTLGILPIGTFNNIARSLGLTTDLVAACAVVTQGHIREVDVGLANEETYFFEAAGTGLDATLFPIGEEIKGGRWGRIFSALKLAMQYRVQPIEITLDRPVRDALAHGAPTRLPKRMLDLKTIRRNAILVVVANGPYYGGGFTVAPGARLSDGRLTVSIYRHFSKLELARHFWSISRGHYRYSPKIETLHSAEIRLDSPARLPVHTDGVPFGRLPVTLRCLPRALRVFAPERPFSGRDEDPPVALPVAQRQPQIQSKEHAR